jgi:hypothetical protein
MNDETEDAGAISFSSFIVHHSSFIIHHSSFIIHRSLFPQLTWTVGGVA